MAALYADASCHLYVTRALARLVHAQAAHMTCMRKLQHGWVKNWNKNKPTMIPTMYMTVQLAEKSQASPSPLQIYTMEYSKQPGTLHQQCSNTPSPATFANTASFKVYRTAASVQQLLLPQAPQQAVLAWRHNQRT